MAQHAPRLQPGRIENHALNLPISSSNNKKKIGMNTVLVVFSTTLR